MQQDMPNISVLILTKNEQQDLPGCLDSVAWSDDIHIFDSMSTDETVAIAEKFGARVTQRDYGKCKLPFGGDESAHRNWAIQNISFKHDWVYHADADERVTPELLAAMSDAIKQQLEYAAFRVRRRDYLMGRWLKHVTPSPFNIRLFKRSRMKFERAINPVPIVDGKIGNLEAHFDHYSFSKGITHWVGKHNSYSTLEAQQIVDNRKAHRQFSLIKAFVEKDFHQRRYHQKELFYRLPFRPLIKFLLLYVGKRGFLDGRAGFTYAMLQSIYEYFIVLKTREIEEQQDQ
jgi:glycosyltransferase involved in cell wall biosynthesis